LLPALEKAHSTNGAEAGNFVKSDSRQAVPDLHFTPVHLNGHTRDASRRTTMQSTVSRSVCQLRQTVAARSRSPVAIR
jgi:hypothetical protein